MFIFSFKVPFLYNSSFLAFFLSLTLLKSNNLYYFLYLLKNKKVATVICSFMLAILLALCSGIFQSSMDYSYLPVFIGNIIYFFQAAFITAIIFNPRKKSYIFDLIKYVCITQSSIILLAFLFPSFHQIIIQFQDATQVGLAETYYGGGVRGLALSGGQFFNLSAIFSLFILTLFVADKNVSLFKIPFLFILFILLTSLTTGRTVLVGFFIGLATVLIIRKKQIDIIKKISLISLLLIAIIYIIPSELIPDSLKNSLESYSKFSFEIIHNYFSTGKIYTSSTDTLQSMYFIPDIKSIILGDGMYTNIDGSYYKNTDSGFMRNILLFGIFGLFFLMFYTLYQVHYYCIILFDKNKKLIFISTSLLLLLLHYKGETFGYLYTVNLLINILFFYSVLYKKSIISKENQHHE